MTMAQRAAPTFLSLCIQHSSLALVYYDYTLTFAREVKYIWQKKIKLMTLLYVFCRCSAVANVIYTVAITSSLDTLRVTYRISSVISLLCRTSVMMVWGARTYAVFGGNKFILLIFGSAGTFVTILATLFMLFLFPLSVMKSSVQSL
ncbi:hypothetical protein BDQ12DRAFT_688103 [Crucibulum laeve]|uniref:DUF6533 domain-containing protein n=1 Tax=Crucibulum laeve TaxID=68775 RepID=A0A5C3LQS1_9AGAR|nr:hypothetical protein BDQ12DRAFT_688103 [Crucibulum laeve]